MIRRSFVALPLIFLVVAACSKPHAAPEAAASAEAPATQVAAKVEPCPDDGPRLPGTGVCLGRAVNYLEFDEGPRPEAPTGCDWVVNETELAGGDYVLYLAARCKGVTTKLDYAGGAHMAVLTYATSALAGEGMKGIEAVKIMGGDPDGRTAILNEARAMMEDKKAAAQCRVREAKLDGWPADALIVDVSAAEAAKAPKDEPRAACGPYGLDEDTQRYWRAFGGMVWLFDLGQDQPEVDPGSFTLYHAPS